MKRRKDYRKFKDILLHYGITRLYHFTDRSNLDSIITNGGLFSWDECNQRGINISRPGGSDLSHSLDVESGLSDYVRLSICKNHPMMYSAIVDGRIKDPVILQIDPDVLFIDGNVFSDKNAVKSDAKRGQMFSDFLNIHFLIANKNSQFEVEEHERDYYQAEILVKRHVPAHYILNLSDFNPPQHAKQERLDGNQQNDSLIIFVVNQSAPTSKSIDFANESMSTARAILKIIISSLKKSLNIVDAEGDNSLSIIGYGDYSYSCITECAGRAEQIKLNRTLSFDAIETSLISQSEGEARLHYGLRHATKIAKDWSATHQQANPPIIIHISEFGYNGAEHSEMIEIAQNLKAVRTVHGNAILFNVIYSECSDNAVLFPSYVDELGNNTFGEMYYHMSSQLPKQYFDKLGLNGSQDRVCLAFNLEINQIENILCKLIWG